MASALLSARECHVGNRIPPYFQTNFARRTGLTPQRVCFDVERHKRAIVLLTAMHERSLVTRTVIEQSRSLMAWADEVLKGRV
jgi:hypothetical protein